MNMGLAKLVVAALIAGMASVCATGPGWLTILIPDGYFSGKGLGGSANGTTVTVQYEDRDGNGYLSFGAPDPKNEDVLIGAKIVPKIVP